ncbi:MAG: hypothetical protein OER88_10670 [Planctomycetota bacterium]|nr:hypothetical protein [Planctomycetota bacterium]
MRTVLSCLVWVPPILAGCSIADVFGDASPTGTVICSLAALTVALLADRVTRSVQRETVRRVLRVIGTMVLVLAMVFMLTIVAWLIAALFWFPDAERIPEAIIFMAGPLYLGVVGGWLRLVGRDPPPASPVHVF